MIETQPRPLVVHRTPEEVDRALLSHLHMVRGHIDTAELALRVGCGAERVRSHLVRLEREGLVRRFEAGFGPRWSVG